MASDTWEDIYRKKDTKELYLIFRGSNNSTYGEKKLALKILKERNFNFDKIEEQKIVWKEESIKKKKEFEKRYPILIALNAKRGYVLSIISVILLLLFYNPEIFDDLNYYSLEAIIILTIYFGQFIFLFFLGLFTQMRINKK